jgi:hypothetical protein
VPDSTVELLDVARTLSTAGTQTRATEAELRRAVSSGYYAVFHKLLQAAARRFMGPDQEAAPAYSILYRSFDHRHMRTVCEALKAATLKQRFSRQLRRAAVSQDTRRFAEIFLDLQDARHLADYDPATRFLPTEVSSLISDAEAAIAAFDRVPPEEQTEILALLMVRLRD